MSLKALVNSGTKVWLDSIDPELVKTNYEIGATGATSNPIIIADLIKTGRFNEDIQEMLDEGKDDKEIAWEMTDHLVHEAQDIFWPVWQETKGNNGYVSFELDPLLEDVTNLPPKDEAIKSYIELGKQWAMGHKNRMIKVPATEAGLGALEELAAAGITLNVTLIFSMRQYIQAREAVWRGAQRRKSGLAEFKSVYSIFVSRVDVWTAKSVPELSKEAQGKVGIVNVKEIWAANQKFWADKKTPLQQEIIFASTGKKLPWQADDYYVEALAGADIQTNPPATNEFVQKTDRQYTKQVDQMPAKAIVDEIHQKVNPEKLEKALMQEGTLKFAEPQKQLLKQIAQTRASLATAK